ncbi:MAG: hydrogenase nickel incorporation protein HypB [Gammaproteobacteria bacterium]|nr:hydrogenase nickel incorporation protein HypB [Gammaproteobacteria bacterium]
MCSVCGCNDVTAGGHAHGEHTGRHHVHTHHHHHHPHAEPGDGHRHVHGHGHDHYGTGPAGLTVPGFTQERLIEIEQDILSRNDADAAANRQRLAERGVLALNLMSSPGGGKTTLLVETIRALRDTLAIGVVEGDQETSNDAERIRACAVPAVQINTGRGCHLDAHMVGHALDDLPLAPGGVVFIENVGNLVCPAAFDLGEARKVVILSVTEGEDKPLKYPDMFAAADLMLLGKTDLLPHVDFDPDRALEYARRVNPAIAELRLSARSGEGMAAWLDWIHARAREAVTAKDASPELSSRRTPAHA